MVEIGVTIEPIVLSLYFLLNRILEQSLLVQQCCLSCTSSRPFRFWPPSVPSCKSECLFHKLSLWEATWDEAAPHSKAVDSNQVLSIFLGKVSQASSLSDKVPMRNDFLQMDFADKEVLGSQVTVEARMLYIKTLPLKNLQKSEQGTSARIQNTRFAGNALCTKLHTDYTLQKTGQSSAMFLRTTPWTMGRKGTAGAKAAAWAAVLYAVA